MSVLCGFDNLKLFDQNCKFMNTEQEKEEKETRMLFAHSQRVLVLFSALLNHDGSLLQQVSSFHLVPLSTQKVVRLRLEDSNKEVSENTALLRIQGTTTLKQFVRILQFSKLLSLLQVYIYPA